MTMVSYEMKITKHKHIFDQTIRIYRDAVSYIINIVQLHYTELDSFCELGGATSVQHIRQQYVERLVHSTSTHRAKYQEFDQRFYKFPSYLRRAAISEAIGIVFFILFATQDLGKWKSQRKKPFLNRTPNSMPCFFRGNTFKQNGQDIQLKIYNGKDWIWQTLTIRNTDFLYVLKNVSDWKASSPTLIKRNKHYALRM